MRTATTWVAVGLSVLVAGCTASLALPPVLDVSLPTLTSVSPSDGPASGGTLLTLVGENFTSNSIVSVGAVPCASVVVQSSALLTCETQAGHPGQWTVSVTTEAGRAALSNAFSVGGANVWYSTTLTGAPAARQYHTQVWTGSKVIVWGGTNGSFLNSGGVYDPTTDTWTATSTVGAPTPRAFHTAVWVGDRMLVWGGNDGSSEVNTGGLYDPVANTWTASATTGAPTAAAFASMFWTGHRAIVFGGVSPFNSYSVPGAGALYNPTLNSWTPISAVGAPTTAYAFSVFTGRQMIFWSGSNGTDQLSGSRYQPANNAWTSMSTAGAAAGDSGSAVWTGHQMIVWGGKDINGIWVNTGATYELSTDSWQTITSAGAPSPRWNTSSLWTGKRMLIWGGSNSGVPFDNGGLYDPVEDQWTSMTTTNAPAARDFVFPPTPIWTGGQFFVWGGGQTGSANTGGLYTP